MQIQPLRGTRNLYPNDMRERNALTSSCRAVLESAGYEEYEAPILESMALYEAKSSAEIIERQSYVFTDRGGEKIVVRPELTPSFARMVANRQGELPSLIRWFSFPECWRYERPQNGRTRNFVQINVDFLGSNTVEADVEIIDLALSIMKKIGFDMEKIQIRINDRMSFDIVCDKLSIAGDQKGRMLTLLDERDKLAPEEFIARLKEISPDILQEDLVVLDDMNPTQRLLDVIAEAKELGWTQLAYDPNLMRGFSYYTGIVFEVIETSGSFNRAVFGGGRYDNLLEAVGGKPMSGIGFAVSDVALLAALKAQQKTVTMHLPKKTFILPFSKDEVSLAVTIAQRLRSKERIAILAMPPYNMKKQLTTANRLGASEVIIVTPEEIKTGNVIVKNMTTGEQQIISINDI